MNEAKETGWILPGFLGRLSINANQIKILALVIMTIDHIGLYMYGLPVVAENYLILRIIGRIAAPLFLYIVVESVRHTSNRPRLILRLYIASLALAALRIAVTMLFGPSAGFTTFGNIFQTFLVTALVICTIDLFIKAFKAADKTSASATSVADKTTASAASVADKTTASSAARATDKTASSTYLLQGCATSLLLIVPVLVLFAVTSIDFAQLGLSAAAASNITDAVHALFPCILIVEYTPAFVLMGVIWYYAKGRIAQLITLAVFALASGIGLFEYVPYLAGFSASIQYWMILSAPFILLYNKKKGGSMKYFFYVYYIVHPYVLIALARLLI